MKFRFIDKDTFEVLKEEDCSLIAAQRTAYINDCYMEEVK